MQHQQQTLQQLQLIQHNNSIQSDSQFNSLAMKFYQRPVVEISDFENDLKLFTYLRKLLSRYKNSNTIKVNIALNYIITIFNCWGIVATDMLFYKVPYELWGSLKPFLIQLNHCNARYNDIPLDMNIVQLLREL